MNKSNTYSHILLFLILSFSFTQCVSTKKHNKLKELNTYMAEKLKDSDSIKEKEEAQRKELLNLKKEKVTLIEKNESNKLKISTLLKELNLLQKDYDKLLANNKNILNSAGEEKVELNNKLSATESELEKRKMKLTSLERDIAQQKLLLDRQSSTLNDQQNRLKEQRDSLKITSDKMKTQVAKIDQLMAMLNNQNEEMQLLKSKISNALLSFSKDELQTQLIDGKLYVSLSQELLFKSGSKTIDKKGVDALTKLANVLSQNSEIQITIEGHTDSDGTDKSNWSLSVERAVSVVNLLQTNGVDPTRIIAAGRGEFFPLYDNQTKEGKAKNRRTEIILSPDMSKVISLLGN